MIRAFAERDLDAAAELLADRHARHRVAEPLLPADVDFRAEVEREWAVEGASGVVSEHGYLFGRPWAHGWFAVGIAGHAVVGDAERARDLYAAAAARWLDAGHRDHMVFVPASDAALMDSWFRLDFGASGALATRETAGAHPFPADVEIRRGRPEDLEAAAALDRELSEAMVPSPSFSAARQQSEQEYLDDWVDTWDDEHYEHFVAERDGTVVSHLLLYRRPPDLRVPRDAIDLANAATLPEARRLGAGRALTEHALAWAHDNGYPTIVTDWRMTNLLASRFWPARGFRTTFLRLHRYVR